MMSRRLVDEWVDPSFDADVYEPIIEHIRRFGRFDALGYDLLPANFTNHQLEPKTEYIARRRERKNFYATRYRRRCGIPVRQKRSEASAVVHKPRVLIDLSHKPRVKIEHRPRVLLELC
jgi:hypothetical protein